MGYLVILSSVDKNSLLLRYCVQCLSCYKPNHKISIVHICIYIKYIYIFSELYIFNVPHPMYMHGWTCQSSVYIGACTSDLVHGCLVHEWVVLDVLFALIILTIHSPGKFAGASEINSKYFSRLLIVYCSLYIVSYISLITYSSLQAIMVRPSSIYTVTLGLNLYPHASHEWLYQVKPQRETMMN